MSHKFRVNRVCQAEEYFENSSDLLESVYSCDLCKKEISENSGWKNGGRLNFRRGNDITHRYEFNIYVCDECLDKVQVAIGYIRLNADI